MLIKIHTPIFRFSRHKTETIKKTPVQLTRAQWIAADRIVIAVMFIATILGAILF
ncbi:hypothetical protein [Pedobacter ghigonis]|uniref:hypothetical protein n=1 Tax=Pedobacter ghigonis TaxID=2730403 RepID=UPI000F9A95E6|nr:hypothetical protein [Pedobacter ghigonis]